MDLLYENELIYGRLLTIDKPLPTSGNGTGKA